MTIGALTMPACTAASPITIAPTMEMVCPIVVGMRCPASRITSKVTSIMRASKIAGNGTISLLAAKEISML
ncbi:hypothetical protein D3C84_993340 [compost metagenome]